MPSKPKVKLEHEEQVAFVHAAKKLFRSNDCAFMRKLLFAIPNGGKRDARTASSLKMEGVRPGVPDLFFAYPRFINDDVTVHGLFIEMKRTVGGSVSPDQRDMIASLKKQGYAVEVAKGCDRAVEILKNYLGW